MSNKKKRYIHQHSFTIEINGQGKPREFVEKKYLSSIDSSQTAFEAFSDKLQEEFPKRNLRLVRTSSRRLT